MSDNPGMPEHDEPSAAELDRVRALLAGLGEEPAPPAVVARLERVLESQLPPRPGAAPGGGVAGCRARRASGARRRRRRHRRRAAWCRGPATTTPQTARSARRSRPAAARRRSSRPAAAPAAADGDARADRCGRTPPPLAPRVAPARRGCAGGQGRPAPRSPRTPAEAELRQAALDAYRETRRVLLAPALHHDRSRPPLPHLLAPTPYDWDRCGNVRRPAARRRRRQPRRLRRARRAVAPRRRGAARPGAVRRARRHRARWCCPTGSPTPRPRPAARRA